MSGQSRLLRRSLADRKIAGVCGGIAEYLGLDPTVVRVVYALLSLGTALVGALVYLLLWFLMPERDYV